MRSFRTPDLKGDMLASRLGSFFLLLLGCSWLCRAELMFELPDRDKQCFYEDIDKGVKGTLEYQVISGGNYDVDVIFYGPNDRVLYEDQRKQYNSVNFDAFATGTYYFCFSNEFSSFTHKVVYFDLQVGDEPPLTPDIGAHQTALTQLSMSTVRIHEALKIIKDYQTHHRLREMSGRDEAEFLNERVQYWSIGESIVFVSIGLTTIFILRRFFASKRDRI